jgi:hypothetical protein
MEQSLTISACTKHGCSSGKEMAGVGNYHDATFIEQGFCFSAFSSSLMVILMHFFASF